jgi:hypothetical protein
MTQDKRQQLSNQLDWALRISAALGPIVTFAALYWLSQHFVTREEWNRLEPKVEKIEQTLIRMEAQQEQLKDHEIRIRVLESKRGVVLP